VGAGSVISIGRRALEVGRVDRWLLAIVVLACAVAVPLPADARAGTYDVWSCRGPQGQPLDAGAWERRAFDPISGTSQVIARGVEFGDSCAAPGGSLAVALTRGELLAAPVAGMLAFRAPPDTRIAGYELARFLDAGQAPLLTTYSAGWDETAAGMTFDFGVCATAGCTIGGPDESEPGTLVERQMAAGDTLALRVEATCPLLCTSLLSDIPARAVLYRSRVTLEDVLPPGPPRLSGDLVDGDGTAGRAALVVAGEDRGAGVEALSLAIDGRPWQTVRAGGLASGCRQPYTAPAPCPQSVEQPFEIDTGALAPGDHLLSGAIADAAGNVTEWGPIPFRVAPRSIVFPQPGPNNGSPAVERPRLRLERRVVTADPGETARLRGRLTTADGRPIAGARLGLSVRQLGLGDPQAPRDRRAVTTDRAGGFAIAERVHGARRAIVSFSPRAGAAVTEQAGATLRSRLSLRAAARPARLVRGRRLTLVGRLGGAGPSATGALVQIQAVVNGRWTPVGRARTGRDGAYRWRYRFVHLTRDTVFRFRPVVERVPGWPWPTVRGPATAVRVDVP
jgi:hypothetical protein